MEIMARLRGQSNTRHREDLLGPEWFIAAYAAGLEQFGYRDSPLEATVYDLEQKFKSSPMVFDAAKVIAASLPAEP